MSWGDVIGGLIGGLAAAAGVFAGMVGLGAYAKRRFGNRAR